MKYFLTLLLLWLVGVSLSTGQSALTAEFQNKKIKLSWPATDESNLNYYAIERSSNGRRFETVAMIKPCGQSDYMWYDKDAYAGTVYYRMKAVNHNRTFEITGAVIAFQVKDGLKEISIYPDLKSPVSVYADASLLGDNEVSLEITDPEGFVMTNCRPVEVSQTACPVILSSSLQKVNCIVSAVLPGKMIRTRLNIYDTSLNFSDASGNDKPGQAWLNK